MRSQLEGYECVALERRVEDFVAKLANAREASATETIEQQVVTYRALAENVISQYQQVVQMLEEVRHRLKQVS